MKVRRKNRNGEIYTIIEESPRYYIKDDFSVCSKADFEPVPTEHWRDVHDSVWFQFNYGFDEKGHQIEGPFKARCDVVRKKA